MTTILQLRYLDPMASAEDIRSFFGGIHIPEGGVCIIGGELGEAFIAFNTEEECTLAIQQSGLLLKDSKVDLHISSMVELEHKVDAYLKRKRLKKEGKLGTPIEGVLPDKPLDPRTVRRSSDTAQFDVGTKHTVNMHSIDSQALILGVCTLLQGLPSSRAHNTLPPDDSPEEPTFSDPPNPGFIRVFGLPSTVGKQDICHFFQTLSVSEVLVDVLLGANRGCLVKFDSFQDATQALSFNQRFFGSVRVEVRCATEKMWINALHEHPEDVRSQQGPLKDTVNYSKNVELPRNKRIADSIDKKPKKMKHAILSEDTEYIVLVSNLPVNIVKAEIKELFGCPTMPLANVHPLLDSEGKRTDKVFVKFDKHGDYDYALNLNGCHVGLNTIVVTQITKEDMENTIKSKRIPHKQNEWIKQPHKNGKIDKNEDAQSYNDTNTRRCLYIRNMPANVRRSQIRGLFTENRLKEDDITLLHDNEGTCIGEAVVQFQSHANVALALMHHGREFLGSKILLTPITVKQMESIVAN
ncbi:unnamed protein product [Knipowitschia caucasica]